ncbi:hypothetical protein WR25_19497 [Diploscapter pachys]|uniref:Fucosyltransferase n=1 Tax=Diploscapter pachys TaxID=2018661 RepID=A0A2A2K0P1_9BILA|nr:hypothetical protein WR25_19497 [Diploscapter pachys]
MKDPLLTSTINPLEPDYDFEDQSDDDKFYFKMGPKGKENESFYIEDVLTIMKIPLKRRLTCKAKQHAKPKIILSWNTGHGIKNLGGCKDWNCLVINDKSRLNEADAESPKNSLPYRTIILDYFNFSLGYRHDTIGASPYGYTVKLAPQSRRKPPLYDANLIGGKTKGAAWFVSQCRTSSRRENIIKKLQKYFLVDVYGNCGKLKCPRNSPCEKMLDTDYHFYMAFENSICNDYITEKLWNFGYKREIIPIVLKRSIVKPYVPPNSFIAADDFRSITDLAHYLNYLIKNKTAYTEYFNWRSDYKVVSLDGKIHDALERPWGFCQVRNRELCLYNFNKWIDESCENDGDLAERIFNITLYDVINDRFGGV